MIGTIDVNVQAKFPAMPLDPMQAYVGSPSSIRVRNVPKKIGNWNITRVQFVAAYPDSTIKTAECVLVGGVWVGTIEGTQTSGKCLNGYSIYACGIDENGSAVSGYCLGKGDIEILKADGTIDPDAQAWYMKLYDEKPDDPNKGDVYIGSGMFEVWNGEEWFQQEVPLPSDLARTGLQTSVSEFINDVGYITANALPTNVSELENDAGYITASAIPSNVGDFNNDVGYITASAIPSDISAFNNDAYYITKYQVLPDTGTGHEGWALRAWKAEDATNAQVIYNYLSNSLYPDKTMFMRMWEKTPVVVEGKYESWYLSSIGETTYDPPIEM